jgi:hypothetical protein
LHLLGLEAPRVDEYAELIALERPVGEHVDDEVAVKPGRPGIPLQVERELDSGNAWHNPDAAGTALALSFGGRRGSRTKTGFV